MPATLTCPDCGEPVWDGPHGHKLAKCWECGIAFDTMDDDDDDAYTPEDDDDYIGDDRGGYSVSHAGRYIGTYDRWERAVAALYLARAASQYWPNVWTVNDHGNVTLCVFHGHNLRENRHGVRMKPGTLFRHRRLLDPDWKPGPGQRYADAPPATCRVTAIRHGRVYYAIGDSRHAHAYFPLDRADEYAEPLEREE